MLAVIILLAICALLNLVCAFVLVVVPWMAAPRRGPGILKGQSWLWWMYWYWLGNDSMF